MKANPNFTYLKERIDNQKILLLQGGTRSGKTYSVIYFIIDMCMKYEGIEIDIVRDTFNALKATAWKDFYDVLVECQLYDITKHNKTDHIYNLSGNLISYYGADDPKKIHGRSRDLLWINEAHQFPEETIDQLFPRTRHKVICDYNPAIGLDHWLDPYIEKYPPLITTYRDNPFLTVAQIEEIELRMERSEYYRKVYGYGERAPRQGVIFENWIEGDFNETLPYCYGLDYGFSPDPLALIRVAVDKKNRKIHAKEYGYHNKLNSEGVETLLRSSLVRPKDLIICDTNEPRTTSGLRKKGINLKEVSKNKIVDDIRDMESYQIIVDPSSTNLKKELSNYVWNDKKASIPIDAFNHLLDALRYAFNFLTLSTPSKSTVSRFSRK